MTNYQSRENDLDNGVQGFPPLLPKGVTGEFVNTGQVVNLTLVYLKDISEILKEQKELLRKSRNLLWQIDEKLSNPKNEPEYETVEAQSDA